MPLLILLRITAKHLMPPASQNGAFDNMSVFFIFFLKFWTASHYNKSPLAVEILIHIFDYISYIL